MSSLLDGDLRYIQRTRELFPHLTANQIGWILPRQTEHIFSLHCDFPVHLHRNISFNFWFTSRLSPLNESLQLVSPPRCDRGQRSISSGKKPFLLTDLRPMNQIFFTPCRLHLHQTRESITAAFISNARKRQWPKCAGCKTFHHRRWKLCWGGGWITTETCASCHNPRLETRWPARQTLRTGVWRKNEKSLLVVISINQLLFVKR